MKKTMKKLLLELLRDSKRSDREIAKVIGVSQPTITRMRNRLVEEGVVREFTVIPDFAKMGYEILAISFVECRRGMAIEGLEEKAQNWWKRYPNVIFASRGQGMGMDGVIISLHKNYTDYSNFLSENLLKWGDDIGGYNFMLISLEGGTVKPLSLKYLSELEETSDD
ncbi:MAG: winged helix-turn-helix transcriptional regulator [Candidatus Bathyarchaeota archaeon]|nr:winged helix-turn-helix transcriptional regulator [Candidatus Bathyarchaeota archaeon]